MQGFQETIALNLDLGRHRLLLYIYIDIGVVLYGLFVLDIKAKHNLELQKLYTNLLFNKY